jgi:hypothetical protein
MIVTFFFLKKKMLFNMHINLNDTILKMVMFIYTLIILYGKILFILL